MIGLLSPCSPVPNTEVLDARTHRAGDFIDDTITLGYICLHLIGYHTSPKFQRLRLPQIHRLLSLQPVSAMSSFLLAMTMYPEVQRKCQVGLLVVVGSDRLPTFAVRDSLPYLATMLEEVIRWGPTTPLGAPHF